MEISSARFPMLNPNENDALTIFIGDRRVVIAQVSFCEASYPSRGAAVTRTRT
jgi:hypothetical protein